MAKRAARKCRVFLSYAHADRWIARQFVKIMEESDARVEVFLDTRDLTVHGKLDDAIKKEIRGCNEFLALLTVNSKSRPWVLTEMSFANAYDKPVTGIVENEQVPEIAIDYDSFNLNDFDDYVAKLLQRVRARMKK